MQIESLDDWREYSDILHHLGYTVFQFQFDIRSPEGFRALFILTGCPDVEIVTHNEVVHDAIVKYGKDEVSSSILDRCSNKSPVTIAVTGLFSVFYCYFIVGRLSKFCIIMEELNNNAHSYLTRF